LIKCTTACYQDGVLWKSLSEAILAKYPSEGEQVVVAVTSDTEGLYVSPSLIVLATIAKQGLGVNQPEFAENLWVVDLNDTRRIQKLDLPVFQQSSPKVRVRMGVVVCL